MNFLKFSAAVLAVTCIASCHDKMITETPEGAGYITVTSQIGSQTKAGYETKTLPAEFIMDINQGNASFNYTKLKMTKDASSNEYIADKEDLKWATSTHEGAIVRAMTIPSGVASIDSDNIVEINLISNQTTLENFNKNDILGARNSENGGITIKGDNINVSFQHLMSKLHVIYETANTSTKVTAITLKNVCLGGAYSYEDINYVGSLEERGNIDMYINTTAPDYSIFAAEAIFFPFEGMPVLEVTTNLGVKTCNLVSQNFKFERGKRYVLKITIDANGNVTKTNISTENDWVKNVPGGKILWIGTSIPAGGGTIYSYPQMVANATGLEVINNAVGGSVVLPPDPAVLDASYNTVDKWNFLYAGGLSQSYADVESLQGRLTTMANNYQGVTDDVRSQWVNEKIDELKNLSYESLIIPYIDGSKDYCGTIIIDHGFNDLGRIIMEANGFHGWDYPQYGGDPLTQYGDIYFESLLNQTHLENAGVPDYNHYKAHLTNLLWPNAYCKEVDSYLLAMEKIIVKCREANPNVNIIIGNYFTENNTWINYAQNRTAAEYIGHSYARTLCYYNKAVAFLFNCRGIVNVQDYITIERMWSGEFDLNKYTYETNYAKYDPDAFCPDSVHPSSDKTGKSNKAIADVYLQELAKIFANSPTTKSTDTFDCGWEDVEIL